jgi:hypothetical protein
MVLSPAAYWLAALGGLLAFASPRTSAAPPDTPVVTMGADGRLAYKTDARGDRVPDFSHAGYMGGGVRIPDVPVRVVVKPVEGDAGARIQAAIDYVSALPPDSTGMRGCVLLLNGRYPIASHLRIAAGGVVLRGQGDGPDGTVLVAAGTGRRTLIQIAGRNDLKEATPRKILQEYVPVGATALRVERAEELRAGDSLLVRRPSTPQWINAIGMRQFPGRPGGDFRFSWVPGRMDVVWHHSVAKVDGQTITLDAPITTALDEQSGGGTVAEYTWPGRISQVGVENLRCESEYDRANPLDEEHAWMAITMESVRDAWVRGVTAAHFVSSAVCLWETCGRVTVEDCRSLDPISEVGGYRRHSFHTAGQQTLFLRCRAERGRRDFGAGYLAAGPNAFVYCDATGALDFSGPGESWASGVLYDNVNTDHSLKLDNREIADQGVGWAAANCMLWNCTAPVIVSRRPPGAGNWVMGCWGQFVGDGHWESVNEFEKPDSLYIRQLEERLGAEAVGATKARRIPIDSETGASVDTLAPAAAQGADLSRRRQLKLTSGWLTCDDKVLTGGRIDQTWWRGHIIPSRAPEYGPNITRFVPGRTGPGLTEDLDALADRMAGTRKVLLNHHWGLWYDQRRQDHQMVRRIDGEVWPPFYEQPWARSGAGRAWDGLSKYDLTRFNPWYFERLRQFADRCDRRGLVLLNQMYFQHNLLEAGAHWVDAPWRPANCLQDLGFAEPPPFENRKRVFMADEFYDVSHPGLREFHRAYIRKSLENFANNTNVIHTVGEEFTGPLAFVQFWLDVVAEWERERGRRSLISLSCTKDGQDAILADAERAKLVSIIEMKHWWPAAEGMYEPKGGQSLAPRQQLRQWTGPKKRSEAKTAMQVRDYRRRFPDKAFVCGFDDTDGWAILAGGGSIARLPGLDERLASALPRMKPFEPEGGLTGEQWALAEPDRHYLVYSMGNPRIAIDLSTAAGTFDVYWIDPVTGRVSHGGVTTGGAMRRFESAAGGRCVLWLARK